MKEEQIKNKMGLSGMVVLELFGPDGKLKDKRVLKARRMIENTITTAGDRLVADSMSDRGETLPTHMAIGTGTGNLCAAGRDTLENELDRNALTSTTQGTGADDNDVIYVAEWSAGDGTGAITEAGIFNAASGGAMLCCANFSAINKGESDTLRITWTVTFGSS